MVTKEQFVNGILAYIDKEVVPSLPSTGKWCLGTMVLLSTSKSDQIFKELSNNSFVKALGAITEDGMIDIDTLSVAVRKTADRYGNMSMNVPLIGVLTFNANDVDKVTTLIKGGAS